MSGFQRPEGGWRYDFGGMRTNSPADSIEATKYALALNIRGPFNNSIQTRPGYAPFFTAGVHPVTDVRSYAAIETDNAPRFLARNSMNEIYLDNSALLGTLDGTSLSCQMIPYRPNNSPQSWMYIGTQGDYKKVSAPDNANAALFYNVGIQEQQNPPDVCPQSFSIYEFTSNAAGWTPALTAGATSNVARIATDHVQSVFTDPASGLDFRVSIEVTAATPYQIGMGVVIDMAGANYHAVIQDILPPLDNGTAITISAIKYYAGTTGRCVIVPSQMPASAMVPTFTDGNPNTASVYSDQTISTIRRGSIIKLAHGATVEKCFVLSVTTGPQGTICFEVSTTNTFVATDIITGLPAIVVTGANGTAIGNTIDAAAIQSTVTAGTGTLSQALGASPFIQPLNPSNTVAQQDDYFICSVNISDLSKLTQGLITFNTDPTVNFTTNGFYFLFNANNLVFHPGPETPTTQSIIQQFLKQNGYSTIENGLIGGQTIVASKTNSDGSILVELSGGGLVTIPPSFSNTATQTNSVTSLTPLPANQFTTLIIPIRSLVRLGNDLTKTLANCNGIQVSLQVTGTVTLQIAGFFIGGGGAPDVANNLSPYFYAAVGRNSSTGSRSNPSPISRYGVSPRRQTVRLAIVDTSADPQNDTWEIYRFGGGVRSWRRIGQMPNTRGGTDVFVDNYFDTQANAGSAMERDNFEPWPTIDVPFTFTAGVSGGITQTIQVCGTTILIIYSSATVFANPAPATILRWLPGTAVLIGGQSAYTLWNRPTAATLAAPPTAHYYAYLLQFVENIGAPTPANIQILEPNVANQHLPFLWGPDAYGTIYGAGDPFRPGTLYFCKNFTPDSAPDKNNQELIPPSEPILGGEILNGLSYAASSNRWWALYKNFGAGPVQYQAPERPVGRGLASPYGHCTDGKYVYFVAKDGVWMHAGGPGWSITDEDLYNLFPHEGVNTPENYTYGGFTVFAPDYKYAGQFRLKVINTYLYFDYLDSNGLQRTLVADISEPQKPKWCMDTYANPATCHSGVDQQEGTVLTSSTRYPLAVQGDALGNIYKQQDNTNDNASPIVCALATFEYAGGDLRATHFYNDAFVDLKPMSSVNITPMANGAGVSTFGTIAAQSTRLQTNVPIGVESKYLGILATWGDDFRVVPSPTTLYAWQPMYQPVPVSVFQWKTQVTSFGWSAYGHLRQWNLAYRSTAPVTIQIVAEDGTSPVNLTLPSTGGAVKKTMFSFTPNKGMLYSFIGTSPAQWTPYLSESELYAGEWGRTTPYQKVHDIDGPVGLRS